MNVRCVHIPIVPVPAPRQVRSDKWKQRVCVMRYRAFKDQIRDNPDVYLVSGSKVIFYLPMPQSWSKKKRAANFEQPHTQKPDIDNLLKALMDALFDDDSHIWNISAEKRWANDGCIVICTEAV